MSIIEHVEDTAELQKARGAFFTPPKIADYVTRWAVRRADDRVLEPSCGEAAFLLAAANRLRELSVSVGDSGRYAAPGQLAGVEVHRESAARARAIIAATGSFASIGDADFFGLEPDGSYDAVVGNPPYVRYQDFSGNARTVAQAAALKAGVRLTSLASSWAAFTVHSALFLKPGGRMGLVLPAELLSVNYAAEVRRFLMESFREVKLVMFSERVFPKVLEEVVLLLADGYQVGHADHASIYQVSRPDDLDKAVTAHRWTPSPVSGKWTLSLLRGEELSAYSSVSTHSSFATLKSWGRTTLGMVTGNNGYFAMSPARAIELGLGQSELLRLSPPGSKHLRGLELTSRGLSRLSSEGASTLLFRPSLTPSSAATRYIEAGEIAGVNLAYKCRVRAPWWRVPVSPPPDLLLTYMNSDTPRLTSNLAHAYHLNSIHGVYLNPELRGLGQILPIASVNSLTLLSAEIAGRAYGGGMLKLEPGEADSWLVPAASLVERARDDLRIAAPEIRRLLGGSHLLKAAAIVDEVLLQNGSDIDPRQLEQIRGARSTLTARRVARGVEPRQGGLLG